MSGTLYGFFRQHGVQINQQTWVNETETIRLREGEGRFRTYAYIAMQEERTKWLAENRPRLYDLVKASGERMKPHATLRSYMMQEVEWIGREAKKRWANWEGHTWFSNQHDGLGVGFHDGVTHAQAETELTRAVSRALGYEQRVNVVDVRPAFAGRAHVWEKRTPEPRYCAIEGVCVDTVYEMVRRAAATGQRQ